MKISVAICTYNGDQYLKQQLASIVAQSTAPDEIIICDDSSSDNTKSIIRDFAQGTKCSIQAYYNTTNIGYTKNFEKATYLSTGDVIFFSDQDDVWSTNKIEAICQLFEQMPDILGITHDGRLVDQNMKWYGTTKQEQIIRGYGPNNHVITGCLSAIRKSCLDVFLPVPDGVRGHDTWLTYIFSKFQTRWLHINLCLQDIRRHSYNTSDWVANSFKPVNRLSVLRSQLSSTIALDYNDKRSMNQALTNRLSHQINTTAIFSREEILAALTSLDDEINAINAREKIIAISSRQKKALAALVFWSSGGYKYFNGVKSFARDLLR